MDLLFGQTRVHNHNPETTAASAFPGFCRRPPYHALSADIGLCGLAEPMEISLCFSLLPISRASARVLHTSTMNPSIRPIMSI